MRRRHFFMSAPAAAAILAVASPRRASADPVTIGIAIIKAGLAVMSLLRTQGEGGAVGAMLVALRDQLTATYRAIGEVLNRLNQVDQALAQLPARVVIADAHNRMQALHVEMDDLLQALELMARAAGTGSPTNLAAGLRALAPQFERLAAAQRLEANRLMDMREPITIPLLALNLEREIRAAGFGNLPVPLALPRVDRYRDWFRDQLDPAQAGSIARRLAETTAEIRRLDQTDEFYCRFHPQDRVEANVDLFHMKHQHVAYTPVPFRNPQLEQVLREMQAAGTFGQDRRPFARSADVAYPNQPWRETRLRIRTGSPEHHRYSAKARCTPAEENGTWLRERRQRADLLTALEARRAHETSLLAAARIGHDRAAGLRRRILEVVQ